MKINKLILTFIENAKDLWVKEILKKNTAKLFVPADIKTSYKASVIVNVWDWHKDRHTDLGNTIESAQTDSHIYVHKFSDKNMTRICCPKMVFSINGAGSIGYS